MFGLYFDDYETPVFRPPSEANSFILRVTRGCAHNRCTFCAMYKDVPFSVYTDEAVDRQIAMAAHYAGDEVRRIFLADGDAFVLPTEKLLALLARLYGTFPNLQRVTSYAGPKDILRKSDEELLRLREAGLKMLYFGLETGDSAAPAADSKGGNRRRIHRGRAESRTKRHEAVHDGHCWSRRRGGVCTSCP